MADIVTAAEVASMQSDLQNWYLDRCSIIRLAKTADTHGGEDQVPTTIATEVRCDITAQVQQMRPAELIGEQVEIRQTYTIMLPAGTDVKFHDKLLITSWTPNREVIVQSVLTPDSLELERTVVASLEGEPYA